MISTQNDTLYQKPSAKTSLSFMKSSHALDASLNLTNRRKKGHNVLSLLYLISWCNEAICLMVEHIQCLAFGLHDNAAVCNLLIKSVKVRGLK